jgi:RND family efflux transporter MFP subunit
MCYSKFKFSLASIAILSFTTLCPLSADDSPATDSSIVAVEGLVMPEKSVDLASPSEGLVTEILAKEGSFLEKGAPIARLNDEEVEIQLRQAELQARQLEEDMQSAKRLFEQKAASRDDLNRAILAAQRASAERDMLKIRLRDRTISAPISGYLIRLLKDNGESVQRMEKVAEIVSLHRKALTVYLDADFFGKLQPEMNVEISPSGGQAPPVAGKIDVIDPLLDAGGSSFRIKILADDPENLLRVGTRVPIKVLKQ